MGYAMAFLFTALAALVRVVLPGVLTGTPYLAFYPMVVAAAALGGFGPGLLATVGSFLCVDLLFDATPGWTDLRDPVVLGRMAIFGAGGIGISLVAGMQRAARMRSRLQSAALEAAANGIAITDSHGTILWANAAFVALTGYSVEEFVGKNPRILKSGEHDKMFYRALWATILHGEVWRGELVNRRKDGTLYHEEMAITPLLDAQGRISHFIAIKQDISTRKAVEQALSAAKTSAEKAKSIAEEANLAKDHFLAVLSHELRTPLTPVQMGVSMLQDRPDLDLQMRETLEMVRRNVEMEARLIDDLLDVTRIARGKIELTRSPVELCTVIHGAVEVCKPDIEARGLKFGVDLGPAPYWVEADVPRLQQVFWNLLKNAIKFTPHGGSVSIRCRPEGGPGVESQGAGEGSGFGVQGSGVPIQCSPEPPTLNPFVVVEVIDSGMGIERESLSRIFRAFEQAERAITRQFGGLGLGLAISKALVELHGGTIEAHSEGRDKGATFRIQLPLCTPAGRPEEPPPAAPRERALRSLRILLVEDHGVTAKMMRWVLTEDGHEVETAGDVATALELADQHAFDLLVSDLGLPDGSGHDLMNRLRERGQNFPGIALSGYGQEEDIQRSHAVGFAAHLTKPASRERLLEAVASVTAGELATHH